MKLAVNYQLTKRKPHKYILLKIESIMKTQYVHFLTF